MANSITLTVGETTALKSFKDHIAYAGMPSENVYSIVQMKNVGAKDALAWNLFFPKSRKLIYHYFDGSSRLAFNLMGPRKTINSISNQYRNYRHSSLIRLER